MPFPEPVIGFFYLIFSGMVAGVAPQGLYQLLGTNGLTEFQRIINSSFVMQQLLSNPNLALTVFAPTNDAILHWKSLHRQHVINSDILQNHISPGAWDAKKLLEVARTDKKQERRIFSGSQNSPLWLQYFPASANRPKSKFYVNDALIMTDQPSQAGSQFLYIIDEVLAPTGSFVTAQTFLEDPSAQMHSDLTMEELQHEVKQMTNFKALANADAVFTFLLPNSAAFSSLKNRGAFDAATMNGHIISDQVIFLRSVEDSLADRSQLINQKQVGGFPSLMNADETSPDSFLGFTNLSSQQQVFSLITNGDSHYPKGRVYANVVKANIPVSNGVIHIIDRILLVVEQDAKEILEHRRDLFKFRELFNFADPKLLERLSNDADLTVFVPTNAALALLPRDKSGRLRHDRILLDKILNMHIIPRRLTSDEINNVTSVLTSIAQKLTFQVRPMSTNGKKEYFVNGNGVSARIVEPDVAATNAVIHVIDQVLGVPFMNALEKLRGEPGLSSTYKAFEQTKDLNSALSSTTANYTVFAPSDQAWLKMDSSDRNTIFSKPRVLAKILKRHLVEGRRMETNSLRKEDRYTATPSDVLIKRGRENTETLLSWKGHLAKITTYDINAVNGVIHIIDHVLFDRDIDLLSSSGSVVFSSLLFVIVASLFSFI